jgi:hypothetical protein
MAGVLFLWKKVDFEDIIKSGVITIYKGVDY